jgi:hypothetical protein
MKTCSLRFKKIFSFFKKLLNLVKKFSAPSSQDSFLFAILMVKFFHAVFFKNEKEVGRELNPNFDESNSICKLLFI